jgi:hypothetical protein
LATFDDWRGEDGCEAEGEGDERLDRIISTVREGGHGRTTLIGEIISPNLRFEDVCAKPKLKRMNQGGGCEERLVTATRRTERKAGAWNSNYISCRPMFD